ncbi:MurR/RpiR family transcriptional regulator [Niallia sp. 01092]|uniref:MurR/RpiR family transcriptional regulator n=1 Tax=unclassified Niallia TaxID=2837522 RepID=UPI003FD55DD6
MGNINKRIAELFPSMSKSYQKIAKYILGNPNTVPFLTADKLAQVAGVGHATVIRFATYLGYSGYPELHQELQSNAQRQLTSTEKFALSKKMYVDEGQAVYDIFLGDIENVRATIEKLDMEAFKEAVEALAKGKSIYIVANRSATALGVFLQYYLQFMLEKVELIHLIETASEHLYDLSEEDVVVGISFARYAKSTVQVLSYAKKRKATTIAITDNLLSPLVPHADITLTANSQMLSFIESFVAPFSLINALIIAVAKANQTNFQDKLALLEDVWENLDVFYKKQ